MTDRASTPDPTAALVATAEERTRPWDKDVQDIADQLVMGVDFDRGVQYIGEMADLVMQARADAERSRLRAGREKPLWDAVIAIWRHTEKHTTYIEGAGYTSRSDRQVCDDPAEHARLAAAEGKAWHDYRALDAQPRTEAAVGEDRPAEPTCPHRGKGFAHGHSLYEPYTNARCAQCGQEFTCEEPSHLHRPAEPTVQEEQ